MEHLQQGLAILAEIGDRSGEADALVRVGDARQQLDDRPGAIDAYRQALAIQRELGNRTAEATTPTHLGDAQEKVNALPANLDQSAVPEAASSHEPAE